MNTETISKTSLDDVWEVIKATNMLIEKNNSLSKERIAQEAIISKERAEKADERIAKEVAIAKERAEKTEKRIAEEAKLAKEKSIEADKRIKDLEKFLKNIGKQIGFVHNERGRFTEDLFGNSLYKLLNKKFQLDEINPNYTKNVADTSIEYDLLAYSNSNVNKIFVVEIKTRLTDSAIKQMDKHIANLKEYFPEHKEKSKYGMIVALSASKAMTEKVLAKGYYFVSVTDDFAELKVPEDFHAKVF